MNNKYNKVPPTLLCPLLICKYQWSASADLCAEYNTVASVTIDRLWAEICSIQTTGISHCREYITSATVWWHEHCATVDLCCLCQASNLLTARQTENRSRQNKPAVASHSNFPVCSNQLFHLLFLNMLFCFGNLRFIELWFLQNAAAVVVLRCYLITCLLVFLSESYLWLMFVFLSTP